MTSIIRLILILSMSAYIFSQSLCASVKGAIILIITSTKTFADYPFDIDTPEIGEHIKNYCNHLSSPLFFIPDARVIVFPIEDLQSADADPIEFMNKFFNGNKHNWSFETEEDKPKPILVSVKDSFVYTTWLHAPKDMNLDSPLQISTFVSRFIFNMVFNSGLGPSPAEFPYSLDKHKNFNIANIYETANIINHPTESKKSYLLKGDFIKNHKRYKLTQEDKQYFLRQVNEEEFSANILTQLSDQSSIMGITSPIKKTNLSFRRGNFRLLGGQKHNKRHHASSKENHPTKANTPSNTTQNKNSPSPPLIKRHKSQKPLKPIQINLDGSESDTSQNGSSQTSKKTARKRLRPQNSATPPPSRRKLCATRHNPSQNGHWAGLTSTPEGSPVDAHTGLTEKLSELFSPIDSSNDADDSTASTDFAPVISNIQSNSRSPHNASGDEHSSYSYGPVKHPPRRPQLRDTPKITLQKHHRPIRGKILFTSPGPDRK